MQGFQANIKLFNIVIGKHVNEGIVGIEALLSSISLAMKSLREDIILAAAETTLNIEPALSTFVGIWCTSRAGDASPVRLCPQMYFFEHSTTMALNLISTNASSSSPNILKDLCRRSIRLNAKLTRSVASPSLALALAD